MEFRAVVCVSTDGGCSDSVGSRINARSASWACGPQVAKQPELPGNEIQTHSRIHGQCHVLRRLP